MSAQYVLLGHHHHIGLHRAHPVQQVLTPRQLDLRAKNALPEPMRVRLDHLSVQSALLALPHQLVHRRAMSAHHVN